MRARSWMAALALIAGTSIAVGHAMPALSPTDDQVKDQPPATAGETTRPESAADPTPPDSIIQAVRLNLKIAGLGREGCDVEVKPANASCKFRVVHLSKDDASASKTKRAALHVSSEGDAVLELREVELRGADRTCAVAITVREPGQEPKTVYRGFRIASRPEPSAAAAAAAAANPSSVPSFTCYLSSPSKVAKADGTRTRK
jgi:hypothetical protein